MKIKHKNINNTYELLFDLKSLKNKDSRLRSRFCRELQRYFIDTVKVEAEEIRLNFIQKDENGNVVIDDMGQPIVHPAKIKEYVEQLNEFDEEYMEIENNDRNKDMLLTVANILLTNEDLDLHGVLAITHDEVCEEFESVIEYYSSR